MSEFERFAGAKTILLTTYRRDGTPVATAVSLALDGGRAFFRTYERSGKAKRLRRNPAVELAPSTFLGKPTGPPMRARARLLTGDDDRRARRVLARQQRFLHGIFVPLVHKLRRDRTQHYELVADL